MVHNEGKTTLTLTNCYGEVSITVLQEDLTVDEMFEDLIIPLLLGATYQQGSIDNYLGRE